MTRTYDPNAILATELSENAADAKTVGEYLARLTEAAIFEQDSYDPARPFGKYGWTDDLIAALILDDHIDGVIESNGTIRDYSETQFGDAMNSVFALLRGADYSTLTLPPEPKDWYVIELDVTDPRYPVITTHVEDAMTEEEAKSHEHPRIAGADPREFYVTRAVHIPT